MISDGTDLASHDGKPAPKLSETIDEHDSLKYHLLGPSLTKAGQGSVDQQKVRTNFCRPGMELIIS